MMHEVMSRFSWSSMMATHKSTLNPQACPHGGLMVGKGPEQPDYTLQRDFMPAREFAALRAELLERRPVLAQRHLDQGYNAVNVNFNLAGAPSRIVPASTFPHLASENHSHWRRV